MELASKAKCIVIERTRWRMYQFAFDDRGTESATPWAREKLYQIINHRYVAKLPTVITTSVSPDDLDPRIRTRILDETRCLIFPLIAPSYRGGHDVRPVTPPPKPARGPRGRK